MRTTIPIPMRIFIFVSFHHIAFRTLLAPLRKPCAETARLSLSTQPKEQSCQLRVMDGG